ncbi:DUF3836 domain-containing protein [Parabacteroides sp. PF5-9]|uniref:DUF3836 domain-containing protein n=1 Tax=Parabacteroides sp. PF5-9 TaxID=1742404 RepID=UPI00247527EF|nr:DUF3836 domain-containing protein [Parabacteroides sp. PF5-9]MDH6356323.1 antitoxin component YwqK of YwqJK toxin-antitoxin module [Parabacteroides sp. PF5-9]
MKKFISNSVLIILLGFVFCTVNAKAETPEFLYNTYSANGKIVLKEVCKRDAFSGSYQKHLAHEYSYDENGNMKSRVTYTWSESDQRWQNRSKIDYLYDFSQAIVSLEYAEWDAITKSYHLSKEKVVYSLLEDNQLSFYASIQKQ